MQTIIGLQIGNLVFDNSNFILQEIKGLEFPVTRLPRYNLPGASGAFISNALYGERKIIIKGTVNAPDGKRITLLTNRATLINNLIYTYDSNGIVQPIPVIISLENGQVLTLGVYTSENTPLQMGFTQDQVDFEEFQLTLIAPSYTMASQTATTAIINLPVGGGTAIPTSIPISLAPSSGGTVVMDNIGSTPSYPIITFTPELTNPYIANNTTGQFLSLNKTLNLGDQNIVIDCAAQTIFQGVNNITGIQTSDSTFWSVVSGNNTIGFSATGGTGVVQIVMYPTFIGL